MPARPRVAVVGSLHYDVMVRAPYLPRTGETLIGEAWWWKPGGKGGNQAMAASRHGAAVEMVGRLGDDAFGARLRERLVAADVGIEHVLTVPEPSGMSVAIEDATGDYAAIVVSGANRDIDAAQIEASADVIAGSAVVVLQNEIDAAADVTAAKLARASGATVILNAAPARPLEQLTGLIDVLVVNTVEAEMLGGGSVDGLAGASTAALKLGPLATIVVVTAGASGVAARSGEDAWATAAHAVEHAQTHGAGDVFVGALAARLAGEQPVSAALAYANAAAALHVGAPEDERDALGPKDVQRLL